MNKTVIAIFPTFLLRKIDPSKIWDNYLSGKYINLQVPAKQIGVKPVPVTVSKIYGDKAEDPTYSFRDRHGGIQVLISSNQVYFSMVSKGETVFGGRCLWCRHQFDHEAVLLPLTYQLMTLENRSVLFIAHGEGIYCDFECCLADIHEFRSKSFNSKDINYVNSEQILRYMFSSLYPNKILSPAQDYRLSKENGGSMEYSEYKSTSSRYYRTANNVMIPLKVQYAKVG